MSKYRIVQVRPEGLRNAFIIEELVITPKTKKVNPQYSFNQGYYESTFGLNAGARPKDWYVDVPEVREWKQVSTVGFTNIDHAEEQVKVLLDYAELQEQEKTFKPKIIKEYD